MTGHRGIVKLIIDCNHNLVINTDKSQGRVRESCRYLETKGGFGSLEPAKILAKKEGSKAD